MPTRSKPAPGEPGKVKKKRGTGAPGQDPNRNPSGVNQYTVPDDSPEWLLLADVEWVQEFPNAEPTTGQRKSLKRLCLTKPLEFANLWATLLRRLKAPNRHEEKLARLEAAERALDANEDVIAETIRKIRGELEEFNELGKSNEVKPVATVARSAT